jgi:hypothetical protein
MPAEGIATVGAAVGGRGRMVGAALLAAACLALAGCAGDAPGAAAAGGAPPGSAGPAATAPPHTSIEVVALEYQFGAGAATAVAGPVPIALRNLGQEQHNVQLIRLDDGVDPGRAAEVLAADPTGAELLRLGRLAGGPGPAEPGAGARAVQSLVPGRYLVACTVRGRSGEVHAADGMVASFEVVAGRAPAAPAAPAATARLTDFGIRLPASLPRHGALEVVNQGSVPHEVGIYRLPSARGAAAVRRYVDSLRGESLHQPPPFRAAGGVGALAPGASARVALDLEPGEYVAICLVPEPGTGPHAVRGMVARFRVGA